MPATLLYYEGERFKAGDVVYARLAVRGFSDDFDGRRCAIVEAIVKTTAGKYKPDPDCEPRLYYIPESHLIEGDVVLEELA